LFRTERNSASLTLSASYCRYFFGNSVPQASLDLLLQNGQPWTLEAHPVLLEHLPAYFAVPEDHHQDNAAHECPPPVQLATSFCFIGC
jgi:hypothetical protein